MSFDQGRVYYLQNPATQLPVPWRWPNFTWAELQSKDGGGVLLDLDAMDKLQVLRDRLDAPIIITSAYRSIAHNRAVGGTKTSFHLSGRAFDISSPGIPFSTIENQALIAGFTGIGRYGTFLHVDTGPRRTFTG